MSDKTNQTLLWVVIGVILFLILRPKLMKGVALAASPDAYYMPPAGGTIQPGTAPVSSSSQALPQAGGSVVVLPVGATTGPAVAARTGRGHF